MHPVVFFCGKSLAKRRWFQNWGKQLVKAVIIRFLLLFALPG
jgi:hypothetical protein